MTERIVYRWPDGAYLYLSATDPDPAEGWRPSGKNQWTRPKEVAQRGRTDQTETPGRDPRENPR